MRIAYSVVITLLAMSAVPAPISAQVLTPFANEPHHWVADMTKLDHPVPVAIVSRVGDSVILDNPRVLQDSSGERFVLGTATMDLSDPALPRIIFGITNATTTPLPLRDVQISEDSMFWLPGRARPLAAIGGKYGRASRAETAVLQPGARVMVQIPISDAHLVDHTRTAIDETVELAGFFVSVGRAETPDTFDAAPNPTKAFAAFLSRAKQ
jgi:hypothetical protein